jgi:hypothetical protein
VLVVGCNIGRGTPFMDKWKEALGDNVELIAPLHFDAPRQFEACFSGPPWGRTGRAAQSGGRIADSGAGDGAIWVSEEHEA